MTDEKDLLLSMFKQYLDYGFHHLKERTNTANIILVLSGVIIGVITYDQKIDGIDIYAILFLIFMSLFGTVWIYKHHERYAYYLQRARGYREKLGELFPSIDFTLINKTAEEITKNEYGFFYRLKMWRLWLTFNISIIVIGFLLLLEYFL